MWDYTYSLGANTPMLYQKEQKPAPLILGYCILAFAVVGCIIEPISGFWLFLPQALVIIAANRKGTYNRQHYEYNISKRTTSIHPTNYSVFTAMLEQNGANSI